YPGAFHHRRIFPQPCETDPRTLCPAPRILYRTIPKMAGRLFRSGSNAGRFALHRLAAAQRRLSVIHACSSGDWRLAPASFFLLYSGSVGSGIRFWIRGLVASANRTRFGKTSIGG